jgi:transposase
MIPMIPGTKVYLACHPVSMRLGFDGLAARVAQVLDGDPFSGHLFLFRAKRAQQATFSIQFSHCQDCLSLASPVRADVAGIAAPSREGSAMYLYGRTARP